MCVLCVAGMNMMGARGGAMENYPSWPNKDGRVMQQNPNMNNPSSKYYIYHVCVKIYDIRSAL